MKKLLAVVIVLASFASIEALACGGAGTRGTRCAPGVKYPVSKVNAQGTLSVLSVPLDPAVLAVEIAGDAAKALYDDLAKDTETNELVAIEHGVMQILGENISCTRFTLGGRGGARAERTTCTILLRNGVALPKSAG